MKLKEYMELRKEGGMVTAWDSVVDSKFYFDKKNQNSTAYKDFTNIEKLQNYLVEHLEIIIIRDEGIVVNLYDFLSQETILSFAKEHFYEESQYGDDEDVKMLLFDDVVTNLSHGYEDFSEKMMECLGKIEKGVCLEPNKIIYTGKSNPELENSEEKQPCWLEVFERSMGLGPYSQLQKEAFDCYVKLHPEFIPGEIIFLRDKWEKFQEYLKNEFSKEKKPDVDSLIQQATERFGDKDGKTEKSYVVKKEAVRV